MNKLYGRTVSLALLFACAAWALVPAGGCSSSSNDASNGGDTGNGSGGGSGGAKTGSGGRGGSGSGGSSSGGSGTGGAQGGTGAGGTLGTAISGNPSPFIFYTALQPDGKVLITGNFTNYNGVVRFGIASGSRGR